jgi:diacylglycerol kinase (ATP)
MRVRELVALLAAHGIRADVRVKLRKSQARDEARAAARRGYAVVIAAGGDGTVEAVARGLVGSRTALGIIPLGTYNNVAHSLGVPEDAGAACALMAAANPRAIDLVQADVRGRKKARVFFEMASIGLGAALIPVGQDAEKGRWSEALASLPDVLSMSPAGALLRLDDAPEPWWAYTLLMTVNNTPLAGAALPLAPAARVDDGLLDLAVYHDLRQADLATRLLALKAGQLQTDQQVRRARAQHVEIHTERPMPVAADSKLIGATPARFSILGGALLAFVGDAPALVHPTAAAAVARAVSLPTAAAAEPTQNPPDLLPALTPPLTVLRRGAVPAAVAVAALALLRRRLR